MFPLSCFYVLAGGKLISTFCLDFVFKSYGPQEETRALNHRDLRGWNVKLEQQCSGVRVSGLLPRSLAPESIPLS